MRLISKVAVLFLMIFNLLSCSKDDEQPTIEGKWEFYKNGYFYSVPETEEGYVLYNHRCETKKDYRSFNAGGTLQQFYFDSECIGFSRDYKWSLTDNGKKLDIEYKTGRGDIFEVLALNETTLKLKFLKSYGVTTRVAVETPSHVICKRVK